MPAVFATFLLLALALACAIAFSSTRGRRSLKWLLLLCLLGTWISLGTAVAQITRRTRSTLVTPGGVRQPRLIGEAAREGLMLAAALGGPALLATGLGWLALRATRQPRTQAPPG